ncbi:hypothetical protein, partial [Staphylococcus aureus]
MQLVIEDDLSFARPARHRPAPLGLEQLRQRPHALWCHQAHEHLLAVPMGLAVQTLNAALAQQCLLNSDRHGT